MPLTIPSDYGYVIGAVGCAFVPLSYGAYRVVVARKKYGVKYPDLYAPHGHERKKEFDCVQRGHQNTLEGYPAVMAMAMGSGLVFPKAAATAVGAWIVGRIMYINGYATGDPSKRQLGGAISHLGDLPLFIMSLVAAKRIVDSA